MKGIVILSAASALTLASAVYATLGLPAASAHTGHSTAKGHTTHGFEAGEPGDAKKSFRTIEILMKDGAGTMSFAPERIEVKKGEQIKFVLKNVGQVDHEFLVDSVANNARHKIEMEKNPDMAHAEPNGARVKPAESRELLWRFSKAGNFEFACLLPGHYESGMKGVVVVR
jgi:uncharacterized cupredoxin-like copper-binding protein